MTEKNEKIMDFETALTSQIGKFGFYQLYNIGLLAVVGVASAFMAGDYVFTGGRLPHRCLVPECEPPQTDFTTSWLPNAIPYDTQTGFDDCRRYPSVPNITDTTDGTSCPAHLFDTSRTVSCEAYVYDRNNTVVFDFGLPCQEWLRALPGTLNSLGGMVALPLAGFISDYFGRRMSILIFTFNSATLGLIRAFSVNYPMYVALQFLQTALGGGGYSAAYILATEIVSPEYRVPTSATMSSSFALGQVFMGLIAMAVYEWRKISIALYAPMFIIVLSYGFILTESHRWLLSKNKNEQAKMTIKKAAWLNRRKIDDASVENLITAFNSGPKPDYTDINEESLLKRILKSPIMLRRCLTTPVWWACTTFVYYGLSINSVRLSGNMYHNYVLTAGAEVPGYWLAVLLLQRLGRRSTLLAGYVTCAACCACVALLPAPWAAPRLAVYLVGKCSIALVFTSLYLATSELYPTRHRHSLLGWSSMVGRVGSVLAPLTPPLACYSAPLPALLFAAAALLCAALVLTQPETKGAKLPNTIEEAEMIGRNK
ncbi:hypothetical protein JYU34_009502 [Plutella xylostella]|uniref:Major facilitator superfamily (MFS) profile domain-containing protein n=1 Tax=Plutella xylostella TaxID=51655 RepID=A0ABQ7QJQ8_PLUXY|nr:hypothetical protein JYU34_009502 [Plutella xylostella]